MAELKEIHSGDWTSYKGLDNAATYARHELTATSIKALLCRFNGNPRHPAMECMKESGPNNSATINMDDVDKILNFASSQNLNVK
uniref:Uncharacterized protein n=1 Tax=Leersia perrieri TaxID=77586 RepID=A0A0D9VFB9_9ORYZ